MSVSPRAPKWARAGFESEADYRAACAATRRTRKAAMLATECRHGPRAVLEAMWRRADFHRPFVTITKQQIMSETLLTLWSVKRALLELREEGSIKAARGWEGGRGIPTTWHLRIANLPKGTSTPSEDHMRHMQDKRQRDAAFSYLAGRYGPMKALEIMGEPPDTP